MLSFVIPVSDEAFSVLTESARTKESQQKAGRLPRRRVMPKAKLDQRSEKRVRLKNRRSRSKRQKISPKSDQRSEKRKQL